MALSPGARIGPYEVLGVIGAGGMGEVYRARDAKLQRDVAIKVLPSAVAGNPRQLRRFEREARALAALNHPNIATVYAIEDGAIVMELVAGDDLSWRVKRGAIPLADALPIARQVAEALAAAHDAGIVHRDLKPANIKVRPDGTVKVLDFGLAKDRSDDPRTEAAPESGSASGPGVGSGSGSGDLPATLTLGAELTEDGAFLGTAAYMAPEQAKGKAVDKRADIWAFGVVLFEMIAGQRPFVVPAGMDPADTVAHVLATEPAWSVLPADTPAAIRRLLARCLTKDRRQRLHDIADARLEIEEAMMPAPAGAATTGAAAGSPWRWALPMALGLLAGLATGIAIWRQPDVPRPVTYARLDVAPATEVQAGGSHPTVILPKGGSRTAIAWSPNGRTLAFIGIANRVRQIFLRDLSAESARPLAGTEGAGALTWSPDGTQIAFWSPGGVSRVAIAGGPPVRICEAGPIYGLTWGATRILISHGSLGFVELGPAGGVLRPLLEPGELTRYASPVLLPGDTAVLFTEFKRQWTSGDERVMVLSLAPGAQPVELLRNAADARYLPGGRLAFMRQGSLFVVPFDAASLELRGEPQAVLKDISQAAVAWDSEDLTLAGQFDISSEGALAYLGSPLASYPDGELVSVDRQGRVIRLGAARAGYRNHVEVSPDGTHIGVSVQTTTDIQAFSYDLSRGTLTRVGDALKGEVNLAAWSRTNDIAVQVIHDGKITAAVIPANGTAPTPVEGSTGFWASSLSREGRLVGMMNGDVWLFQTGTGGKPPTVLTTARPEETQPYWSPDGRWLAYTSSVSGRREVYVQAYPDPGAPIMVSTHGGGSPGWNPNGRELFYIEPIADTDDDRMMAVTLSEPGHPGKPRPLFSFPRGGLFPAATLLTPYAVAPDGQHFYAARQLPRTHAPATEIAVVFNWLTAIKTVAYAQR